MKEFDPKDAAKYCAYLSMTSLEKPFLPDELLKRALDPNDPDVFCTYYGTIVVRTDRFVIPLNGVEEDAKDHGVKAYQGVDFITIDKDDAQNIIEMLRDACTKLHPDSEHPVNDFSPFKAISFDRLVDRASGELCVADAIMGVKREIAADPDLRGME